VEVKAAIPFAQDEYRKEKESVSLYAAFSRKRNSVFSQAKELELTKQADSYEGHRDMIFDRFVTGGGIPRLLFDDLCLKNHPACLKSTTAVDTARELTMEKVEPMNVPPTIELFLAPCNDEESSPDEMACAYSAKFKPLSRYTATLLRKLAEGGSGIDRLREFSGSCLLDIEGDVKSSKRKRIQ